MQKDLAGEAREAVLELELQGYELMGSEAPAAGYSVVRKPNQPKRDTSGVDPLSKFMWRMKGDRLFMQAVFAFLHLERPWRHIEPKPVVKKEISTEEIVETVLKVCTRLELRELPPQVVSTLFGMVARRLEKEGAGPTLPELEGIKELATEHLWHPALSRVAAASRAVD